MISIYYSEKCEEILLLTYCERGIMIPSELEGHYSVFPEDVVKNLLLLDKFELIGAYNEN